MASQEQFIHSVSVFMFMFLLISPGFLFFKLFCGESNSESRFNNHILNLSLTEKKTESSPLIQMTGDESCSFI
jgi:hypothetical protein